MTKEVVGQVSKASITDASGNVAVTGYKFAGYWLNSSLPTVEAVEDAIIKHGVTIITSKKTGKKSLVIADGGTNPELLKGFLKEQAPRTELNAFRVENGVYVL